MIGQVGYHYRYVGAFQEMKRLIEAGAIGRITHVWLKHTAPLCTAPQAAQHGAPHKVKGGVSLRLCCAPAESVELVFRRAPDQGDGLVICSGLLGRY